MKIINKIQDTTLNYNPQYKYSFLFPFIINSMGSNITNDSESIIRYTFSMFTLSLIVLISFINIIGYILSLYLLSKYDIENKYPKYIKIIKYFEKSNKIFILFEIILCILILLFIILINLILCGSIVLK